MANSGDNEREESSGDKFPANNIKQLQELPWFHGDISRNATEVLLLSNADEGHYLLRTSANNPGTFSVSVRCKESVKHYTLEYDEINEIYTFGKGRFSSLQEVIDHFDAQPVLVNASGLSVILKHPYKKNVEEPDDYEDVVSHSQCGNAYMSAEESFPDLHMASKEGYMMKRGFFHKNWKRRWFVLQKNLLKYHKDKDKDKPIRTIDLRNVTEVSESSIDQKFNCFKVCLPRRTFYIYSKSPVEAQQWMKILQWKVDYYLKVKAAIESK